VFAPEATRAPPSAERPHGAFGQRFPQNVPAAPSSAAVTGVMRIQPQVRHPLPYPTLFCSYMRISPGESAVLVSPRAIGAVLHQASKVLVQGAARVSDPI